MPGEDAAKFHARLDAWTLDLAPQDEIDRYLVTRAVEVSWKLDRVRVALELRRTAACRGEADRLAAEAEEVVALGRRLFHDPVGPLCLYPHAAPPEDGEVRRVSYSSDPGDADDPAQIVVRLEALTLGCAWLLDRWGELRETLESGQAWQPHDRLKAVRMLGRQPLDAPDDRRVMRIYLCGQAMEPRDRELERLDLLDMGTYLRRTAMDPLGPYGFSDVANELDPDERRVFVERLGGRGAMEAMPKSAEEARAALLALIAEEEERLEGILAGHLEREEAEAAATLAFDASVNGERLRRYESDNDRLLLRIIETLRKRHREADGTAASGGRASVRAADPPPPTVIDAVAGPRGVANEEVQIHPALTAPAPAPSAVAPARAARDEAPLAEAMPGPARTEPRLPADPEPAVGDIELAASIDPTLPDSTDRPDRRVAWTGLLAGAVLALFALLFFAGIPAAAGSTAVPPAANSDRPTRPTLSRESGDARTPARWLRSSKPPGGAVTSVRGVCAT